MKLCTIFVVLTLTFSLTFFKLTKKLTFLTLCTMDAWHCNLLNIWKYLTVTLTHDSSSYVDSQYEDTDWVLYYIRDDDLYGSQYILHRCAITNMHRRNTIACSSNLMHDTCKGVCNLSCSHSRLAHYMILRSQLEMSNMVSKCPQDSATVAEHYEFVTNNSHLDMLPSCVGGMFSMLQECCENTCFLV